MWQVLGGGGDGVLSCLECIYLGAWYQLVFRLYNAIIILTIIFR